MTFPATYNINYYLGDTHEFKVYPKDSSGAAFPLATYTDVEFVIAENRGPVAVGSESVAAYAEFSVDRTNVECAITPLNSADLDPTKSYVYDVKISKTGSPYDSVHTLLTGNLTISNRVDPLPEAPLSAPSIPTLVTVDSVGDNSINLSWTAPEIGGAPDGYRIYVIPYSPSYESTLVLQQLLNTLPAATPFTTTETFYSVTDTTAIPDFGIESVPLESGTAYVYVVASYNTAGFSDPVGNFDLAAGTIDEVFTSGGS